MPHVGASVRVDFLGSSVTGIVSQVEDEGRRLEVHTDDGAVLIFALNRATATFTVDGGQTAARLRFGPAQG